MLQFGLRLGERPRQVVTTTPRPTKLIKSLIADPLVAVTRVSTAANAANLAPSFLESVVGRYRGTRLGRQELDAELLEDRADALWPRALIEACSRERRAGADAHRRRGRSAGLVGTACRCLRHRRGGAWGGRHAPMCLAMRRSSMRGRSTGRAR